MRVSDKIEFLPPDALKADPDQPRKTFDNEKVNDMAKTILSQGIIAPIEIDEDNVIVTGELRWRASTIVKVPTIPCRRLFDITPDERLERQLVENIHRQDIDYNERDQKIYELYMSGRYGPYHTGQGKAVKGTIIQLAKAIGLSPNRIGDIIEAIDFKKRTSTVKMEVPISVIAETVGLPDKTRIKLLEKVMKKEVKQPSGQTDIRKAVRVVKNAPDSVKEKFLEGEMPLDKALEITEVAKDAPEPIKEAVADEKISTEQAILAKELYKTLSGKGNEIPEERIKTQVEELSKEKTFLERRQKQTLTRLRRGLSGAIEKPPEVKWNRLFCGTMNNLSGLRDGNITHNRIRYFTKTPEDIVCPHFWEFVWATGCAFRPVCSWCYLQGTFRGNMQPRFFDKEELEKQVEVWFEGIETLSHQLNKKSVIPQILDTGELADSFMGEEYWKEKYGIPFSQWIMGLIQQQGKHKVLFLTKSDKVEHLLDLNPKQTIVSFSLNAEPVAKKWEEGASKVAPIVNRIEKAGQLQKVGYEVRIRIDPMVPILNWEEEYKHLVDDIFLKLVPERITIGSLRGLESTIRLCHDRSWVKYLAKDETGWGRKIADRQRFEMYSTMIDYITNNYNYNKIAFCKETEDMWIKLGLNPGTYPQWSNCNCNCV